MKVKSLSRVRLLATPRTAAHQAPPSMGFSRHEYWSGLPLPSPKIYDNKHVFSLQPHSWCRAAPKTLGISYNKSDKGGFCMLKGDFGESP